MRLSLCRYWDLLAHHIRQPLQFAILTVLLLSSIGLQVFSPRIMRGFIDATQTGVATSVLISSALTFIALAILQQLVTIGAAYFGENVAWTATNSLRAELARHCLDLDMGFHGNTSPSVRDNLTFFDRSISDDQIQAVIEELELAEWYGALPQGLNTQLETGGRGLSAGEAQLLAFTRVFLRDPGLVILDEASSRLDPATEQLIERAVDKLLRNRTAIVIAHRLGTVHRADEIMILQDGEIAEHGQRTALVANPHSRFSHLLQNRPRGGVRMNHAPRWSCGGIHG